MSHSCNLKSHGERRFCCAKCSRAFSSMEAFDWHAQGFLECRDPADAIGKDGQNLFVAKEIEGADGGTVPVWGRNTP